jgi:hypothetical protein
LPVVITLPGCTPPFIESEPVPLNVAQEISLSLCAHHKGVGRDNWKILKFDDHDEN